MHGRVNIKRCEVFSKIKKIFGSNICDALHDLVPFVQLKNLKNTHGGVLLLIKLQVETYIVPNHIMPQKFWKNIKPKELQEIGQTNNINRNFILQHDLMFAFR